MDEATVFVSSSLRLIDSWKTTALCFLFPGCFHFFFGPTVTVKCKVTYIANFGNNCASWVCFVHLHQSSWMNHNLPHSHFLFFSVHVTADVNRQRRCLRSWVSIVQKSASPSQRHQSSLASSCCHAAGHDVCSVCVPLNSNAVKLPF